MNCPLDDTTLEKHTIHSVEVAECPQCRGVWFDHGELRDAKDAAEPDLNWLDFDLWSNQDSFNADWSTRNCPVCEKKMASIAYADTGVIIEYCIDEHGIWLDQGEFQAIIEALHKETLSMDSSEYLRASLAEAGEIISGKEGFLSEWQDFLTVTRLLQYRVLVDNPRLADLLTALQSSTPFR